VIRRLALLLLLVTVVAGCGRYLAAGVAVVNGESVSTDEFRRRVAAAAGETPPQPGDRRRLEVERQVIAQLIQEEIIGQEVEKRRLAPNARNVEARLADLRGSFASEQEFRQALTAQGLTLVELRDRIRQRLALDSLREALIGRPITDADLRAAYQTRRESFEEIRVSHILFSVQSPSDEAKVRAEAEAAVERLRVGADFAALAGRLSDDPGSKTQGGDLGVVTRGRFVPEFEGAAFALPVGKVSDPVRTQFGFHLILVKEKRVQPFEQVREQLRVQLLEQRGDPPFQSWLARALRSADIVVNPRYGDWDPKTGTVVEHHFFVPASSPETQANP
jgi:foldase protein PrsA